MRTVATSILCVLLPLAVAGAAPQAKTPPATCAALASEVRLPPWFREMARRKHSITADALARNPKPLEIVTFDDAYTVKDQAMEMQLVHLVGSTHGDGIIAAYFPAQRVFAEPDVWNPGAQIQPHLRSLYADITRRGLQIDRIVPLHGTAVQPYPEFLKVVREWTGLGS